MRARSLVHLSDGQLVRELKSLASRERIATAAVVAHLAEVDARKLYLPAGYPSMHAWCVGELGLSEDAAYKRITAARTARRFPELHEALAGGRLHLTAIRLLAPYMTQERACDLIRDASGKSRAEIEFLLATRFPRSEMLPMVEAHPADLECTRLAPGRVEQGGSGLRALSEMAPVSAPATAELAPGRVGEIPVTVPAELAPGRVVADARESLTTPIAPGRFAIHLTVSHATHDKLMQAQALLSHRVPQGDLAQVLDRVLDAAIAQFEKEKFAKTSKPRPPRPRTTTGTRHIPAHVRRAVRERDEGRCTFVSTSGRRCGSKSRLEFDHVEPVAAGGATTAGNLRLRCRAHNQYEAERAFGARFMQKKREQARVARANGAARRDSRAALAPRSPLPVDPDLVACLRTLGFRAGEIREAVTHCGGQPDASLEERVRFALSWLRPKGRRGARVTPPGLRPGAQQAPIHARPPGCGITPAAHAP